MNLFVMVMLVVLSIFLSILSIILLNYYYCHDYNSYFLIFIPDNLRTIDDINSAEATDIKPGQKSHKCRIMILKPEQDICMQMNSNNQDYESPEEIAK